MKSVRSALVTVPDKAPTGITGFDEIIGGGLPCGRTTLLSGGPGSGKTLFALRFLGHGALDCKEPGIFAAFEEDARRIVSNATSFGWKLVPLQKQKKLFFVDAQPMSDLVQAGECNRGLSIVKSRGTAHSNQVRELIISDAGVTLSGTYTAGGEVLMGTLRWEKERAERATHEVAEVAAELKRVKLDAEEAERNVRLKSLQTELVAKQVEKALLVRSTPSHEGELSRGRTQIKELRGADAAITPRK